MELLLALETRRGGTKMGKYTLNQMQTNKHPHDSFD